LSSIWDSNSLKSKEAANAERPNALKNIVNASIQAIHVASFASAKGVLTAKWLLVNDKFIFVI
jgi:hypothetical protein